MDAKKPPKGELGGPATTGTIWLYLKYRTDSLQQMLPVGWVGPNLVGDFRANSALDGAKCQSREELADFPCEGAPALRLSDAVCGELDRCAAANRRRAVRLWACGKGPVAG